MNYDVYSDAYLGDFTGSAAGVGAGAMLGVMLVAYLIVFAIAIAVYIVEAVAFMKMAKKVGVPNAWLAFIPIGNVYILGKVADAGREKRNCTKMLMIGIAVLLCVIVLMAALLVAAIVQAPMAGEIPAQFIAPLLILVLVAVVAAVCVTVFSYIALYSIANNFGGENGSAYFIGILLGSFFMPIVTVILLFILSRKTPKTVYGAPAPTVNADNMF